MRIFEYLFMMKFKNIIAETLMLMEDVAKAEKLLKQYVIPIDNPDYLGLKQKMAKDNAIGFLGIVMNLVFDRFKIELTVADQSKNENNLKQIFAICSHIYNKIMNNRNDLNFLPKGINQYTQLLDLEDDLNNIPRLKLTKRFANLIIDKNLKAQVIEKSRGVLGHKGLSTSDLKFYFEYIDGTTDAKTFKQKLNRYKTADTVMAYLTTYIDFYKRDFSYKKIIKKVNEHGDLKVLYNKNEKVLVHVTSHEGLKAIGSPSWCIYGSSQTYSEYTQGGRYNQYVFFNFDETINSKYSIIGFTMDGTRITASHLMNDNHIDNVMGYLNNIGVYPKIKAINTELEQIKRNKEVVDRHIGAIKTLESDRYMDTQNKRAAYGSSIKYILKSIMGDPGTYGSEYEDDGLMAYGIFYAQKVEDVQKTFKELFNKFFNDLFNREYDQNILITKVMNSVKFLQNFIWLKTTDRYDDDGDATMDITFKEVNLLSDSSFFYATNTTQNPSSKITNIFKKLFVNFKEMDEQTYSTILNTLKRWEVSDEEINNLIRFRKTKYGEDYTHMEFHNLKSKGNLSGIILNKIQKARRGEDVEINYQEVQYGIEKGMKNTLANYFRTLLPQFEEHQVDLDDARIYKDLGMGKELKDVVLKKYNMMGGDQNPNSINSIERSVLDVG